MLKQTLKKLSLFKIDGNVSPHYKKFLINTCLSNVVCGIESVMSTYSMLDATGVGKDVASLSAISLNLIGKDIVGQIFSVPVTTLTSNYGDKNPINYTKFNVVIYSISNMLEFLTPLFPKSCFILVAATGNIGKNIGYNGFGAFTANAINKVSIDKTNISEIHSKITSSIQLSYSFGMMLGLGVVNLIPCYYTRMCFLPILGCLRYYFMTNSIKGLL